MNAILGRILSFLLPDPPDIEPGEEVVWVDVRTPAEWERGHVAGAKLIPHQHMDARWTELREHRDDRVLVYCRSGSRSRIATEILRSKGFENVENAGGLLALRVAGIELEEGR